MEYRKKGICVKCGGPTSRLRSKQCKKCFLNRPNNTRSPGVCLECGGPTSRLKIKRCQKCKSIPLRKWKSHYECAKDYSLRKNYGITLDEFEGLWIAVWGKCQICKKNMKRNERRKGQSLDTVAVDHNHTTGNFRGLLCAGCNKGLGFFKDDPELLRKALRYLE